MKEGQGQIHGLISRDQMHDMWLPHGERLTVSAEVSDDPTGQELAMMYLGSDLANQQETQWLALEHMGEVPDDWYEKVYEFLFAGANDDIKNVLLESYDKQLHSEAKETEQIQDRNEIYLSAFSGALGKIAANGILSNEQADLMASRLHERGGEPFMQIAPMTILRKARLQRLMSNSDLVAEGANYATNMQFGLIEMGSSLRATKKAKSHNMSHELLHSVQGLEVHDVTRDDGLRVPIANTVGHFQFPVTTELEESGDYSKVENTELTEGFIEYLNLSMHEVEPGLGPYLKRHSYLSWMKRVARIHQENPDLFQVITDVSLTEADTAHPNAKKDALDEMHEHGVAALGEGGITAYMQSDKQFSEVYSTDKRPDAIVANAMS